MHGWGLLDEAFFFGVPVEAGDGAEPAADGGPGTAEGFEVAAELFDVGAA